MTANAPRSSSTPCLSRSPARKSGPSPDSHEKIPLVFSGSAAPPPPSPAPRPRQTEPHWPRRTVEKNAPLIGIDIGGTGIKGGVAATWKKGKLIGDRLRIPTPQPSTPESVAEVVAQVVAALSARPDAPAPDSPVGVTFPGIIQHGVVHSAANVDKVLAGTRHRRPADRPAGPSRGGHQRRRRRRPRGGSLRRLRVRGGTVLVITLGTGIGSAFIFDMKLVSYAYLGTLRLTASTPRARPRPVARERDGLSWEE